MRRLMSVGLLSLGLLLAAPGAPARAQAVPALPAPGTEAALGTLLLTAFLRHDQSKTVGGINAHLKATGWYERFPGAGVGIVSWYVMMGVAQVVTLRVPAGRLRDVNRIIEGTAWGGYPTLLRLKEPETLERLMAKVERIDLHAGAEGMNALLGLLRARPPAA